MAAPAQDRARYALVPRLLHWLIAVLVIGALILGVVLRAYGFEGLRDGFRLALTNAV